MQAVAAEFSGCARKILLLFGEKSLKHFVSIHLLSKPAQHHIPSQPASAQDWGPPGYGAGHSNPQ